MTEKRDWESELTASPETESEKNETESENSAALELRDKEKKETAESAEMSVPEETDAEESTETGVDAAEGLSSEEMTETEMEASTESEATEEVEEFLNLENVIEHKEFIYSEDVSRLDGEAIKEQAEKPRKKIMPKLLAYGKMTIPLALLFIAVSTVVYYILFPGRNEYHSDCTDTIYWAKASYDSGHIFNEDFDYACLLPFGTSLIMQFFMNFFGLSMTTHILGMLSFFLLFIGFFCLMLREMHWNLSWICGAGTILLTILLSSAKLREIFWGHTIYYSLGILFLFIGLFLLFRMRNLMKKRQELRHIGKNYGKVSVHLWLTGIVLFLFFMLSCTNQIATLTIFSLPFLVAIFLERLLDAKTPLLSKRNCDSFVLLVGLGVMMLAGLKLGSAWAGNIVAGYQESFSNYVAQFEWLTNAQKFPLAWMTLLGVQDIPGKSLMGGDSIRNLIRMMAAILLAALPIAATICYPKYQEEKGRCMRVLIWVHWGVTALIMVGYICGLLSVANWRLSPILCTAIMVSVAFLEWAIHDRTPLMRFSGVLLIPIACFCILNTWQVLNMPRDAYKENEEYQLADFLREHELDYGYATFWYANAITVMSNSDVEVRNVNVEQDGVTPYYYQTERSWYEDQEEQENYFLLLEQGEYDYLMGGTSGLPEKAEETLQCTTSQGNFYVMVFAENLF